MRSVLLVDDSPSLRLMARMVLESEQGWVVVGEAGDGQEAVDVVEQMCPDVIVLDQQMPLMAGLVALPLLRARCPAARIVMWSSDPTAQKLAIAAGVDAFVDKSAPMEALLDALHPSRESRVAEQRRADRAVPIRKPEHLVLTLPAHRIVPGATVSWVTAAGLPRRIVLPPDVTAGMSLPLESVGVDGTPRHLLLLSA